MSYGDIHSATVSVNNGTSTTTNTTGNAVIIRDAMASADVSLYLVDDSGNTSERPNVSTISSVIIPPNAEFGVTDFNQRDAIFYYQELNAEHGAFLHCRSGGTYNLSSDLGVSNNSMIKSFHTNGGTLEYYDGSSWIVFYRNPTANENIFVESASDWRLVVDSGYSGGISGITK